MIPASLPAPARFLAVGLLGLAVDTALLQAGMSAGMDPRYARLGSLAVATLVTWSLNRRITFAPTGRGRRAELARYLSVTLCAQGFSYAVFVALLAVAPILDPKVSACIGAILAAGLSYAGQRLFTFAAVRAGASA